MIAGDRTLGPPLVSVVTPSYNQGAYIAETIRSIGEQDYPNIEHIIVDGGSTDETLDVIRRHEEAYDLRWISEPDGGMYEAVNKGLRMARGEILAYLNSDDRYFPWTVSTAVRELTAHREVGFVFGDAFNVDDNAESGLMYFFPPFRLRYMGRSGVIAQPTVFWRRSVYEDCGGFDESLEFVADCDYWLRISERYRARKVNEVLAIERNHPAAKRLAQTASVHGEFQEVRARYVKMRGLRHQVLARADRFYDFLWRRYYLSRFLISYLLRSRLPANTSWSAFLTRDGDVRVRLGSALATLVPLTGGRFSPEMVHKDLAPPKQGE